MITLRAQNYAKLLYAMGLREEIINHTKTLLDYNDLIDTLNNPVIEKNEKESVIDALFDKVITGFLKVLCNNNAILLFSMIMKAYENILLENQNIVKAKLKFAMKPEEKQIDQIKNMLCIKYNKTGVSLELEEDASLIGGYILYVGDTEYNKSIKGTLYEMQKTLVGR